MANKQRGEIPLTIDGRDYTLYLGTNALELLEEHFSVNGTEVGWQDIVGRVLKGNSLRYLRAFIWAALQKHHPGTTLAQAGDLIDAGGGISGFAQLVSTATGIALPTTDDLKALGIDPERPPTAQKTRRKRGRPTGTTSTATAAESV